MNLLVKPPAQENIPANLENETTQVTQLLANEIKGAQTYLLTIKSEETVDLSSDSAHQAIYFLISGTGRANSQNQSFELDKLSLFVPKPNVHAEYTASTTSRMLKITMELSAEESENLQDDLYPMFLAYQDCEKYRDYFKSEKTVSRTLVHPFTLPRFCMGSVETTGLDRIEPHAHPMLDQLFLSFSENSCNLLIDGETFRYEGDNLLHIPLGCDHGIDALEGDVVHYLWLDFFEDAKEMQYLVEVHKPVEG